jgi:hypothetical protein
MALYTIPYTDGKDVILKYDDKKHAYSYGEKDIPSVTKILNAVFPKNLTEWAAKAGADWWLANTSDDVEMQPIVYDGIRSAYKEISNEAKEVGTQVHKWIELWIKFKIYGGVSVADYPFESKIPMRGFHKWVESRDIEWILTEQKVYSKQHQFAGTVDAVAKIDGKVCVIDFKTSAKIYKEHYLQVSAYYGVLQEMGIALDYGMIVRFDKEEEKYQEVIFDASDYYGYFLNAKSVKSFQSTRIKKVKL